MQKSLGQNHLSHYDYVKKKKIDSMQQNKQKKKNPQVANGTCSVDKSHLGN